jgi:aminoglycoside phosphotransferase (APT) family kinase protein
MQRLAEVGYPVPSIYHLDGDGVTLGRPFLVMEFIDGTTLDTVFQSGVDDALSERITQLISPMVRLHKLDVSKFTGIPALQAYTIHDFIEYYSRTRESAPWVAPVIDWLNSYKPEEAVEYYAICHNDYHGMNVMLNRQDQPVVIDWAAARICDSRIDLAWTVTLYNTFGGTMYMAPIIESYRKQGGNIESLDFFLVLAVTRRIVDVCSVYYGDGASGLKPDTRGLMRESRDHFIKVHAMLEEFTGIRLAEFDKILEEF